MANGGALPSCACADGGVLAHIVDVSELVAKEEAIEAASRDAEQARERLAAAIEHCPQDSSCTTPRID